MKNRKWILEKRKRYGKDNPEKIKEISKRWRENNKGQEKKRKRQSSQMRRKYIADYKLSKGCVICGYNKCVSALDFHHDGDKEFAMSQSVYKSLETIKKEIEKCVVICSNCHRELHEKLNKGNKLK